MGRGDSNVKIQLKTCSPAQILVSGNLNMVATGLTGPDRDICRLKSEQPIISKARDSDWKTTFFRMVAFASLTIPGSRLTMACAVRPGAVIALGFRDFIELDPRAQRGQGYGPCIEQSLALVFAYLRPASCMGTVWRMAARLQQSPRPQPKLVSRTACLDARGGARASCPQPC